MYHIARHVARRVCAIARALIVSGQGAGAMAPRFPISEQGRLFYWIPVLMGGGIAIYFALRFEPSLMVLSASALLALALMILPRNGRLRLASRASAFLLAGFCLAVLRTLIVSAPVLPAEIGPAELTGEVLNVEMRETGYRLVVAPVSFAGLRPSDLPARLRVSIRTRGDKPLAGQMISMRAVLRPPPAPVEPGAFDFQRHLFFQGIGGVGYAVGPVVVRGDGTRTLRIARLRNSITERINDALTGQAGALAAALLVGDRGRVDGQSLRALRDSGLAHLLAISGLHVGLVAGFLFVLVRGGLACWPAVAVTHPIKKYAAVAAASGAGAYLVLAGGSIPTQRAFIVVLIGMMAVLLDRRAISLRVVAVAALVVLILTPDALVGASFQMSFAAVLGLVAAYESIGQHLQKRAGTGPLQLVGLYILGILATTVIASLATAPFAIHHFNRVADYGVVANLAAMPVMAFWVMPAGVVSMLAMPLGLEHWPLVVMGQGIEIILLVADTVSGWPGAVRLLPSGPDWAFAITVLGGLWLALVRHRIRLLGLILILGGMTGPWLAELPDIRVSADGKLAAVRATDGGLILSSNRRQKFTAEQWLRRDGLDMTGHRWPTDGETVDSAIRCDAIGCVWRGDAGRIALPNSRDALADDCALADAVIATIPAGRDCQGRDIPVHDFFDLWRDGAISVFAGDRAKGIIIRAVNRERGQRPWVWRPTPRRLQYWRKG